MSGTQFVGIKLEPGKPHELRVPDGELLQFQQVALSAPPKKDTVAVISIKTSRFPELVVCTLRAGCEQCQMELIVLATEVLKQRHLSSKRRRLVLSETMDGSCRLFYLDPETGEVKVSGGLW